MPADTALLVKGLAFISISLLLGFYTSHYLRAAVSDGYVHSGNLNDVGWTGLMGGDGETRVRVKRMSGNEEFGIVPDSLTAEEEEGDFNVSSNVNKTEDNADNDDDDDEDDGGSLIFTNMVKVKRSAGSDPGVGKGDDATDNDDGDTDDDPTKWDVDDDDNDDDFKTWDTDEDDEDDDFTTWDTDDENDDFTTWDTADDDDDDDDFNTWDTDDNDGGDDDEDSTTLSTAIEVTTSGSTGQTDVTATTNTVPLTGSTVEPTSVEPTSVEPTSVEPTSVEPTTEMPTTIAATTEPQRDYMRTVEPETLTECQAQPFIIQNACPTGGDIEYVSTVNVTVEELSMVLFDVDVLLALENKCDNSTWCLGHEYDKILWYSSQMYKSYCDFIPCLLEISDECLTEERRMTIATLVLLCQSDLNNITNPCLLSLRRMSHVSFLSLFRARDENMYDAICNDRNVRKCSGPCYDYSHQLYCTYESCNESTMWIFQEYGPWQWLFNDDEKMETCEVASSNCTAFQPPSNLFIGIPDNFRSRILAKILDMDHKLAIGIVMSIFIALIAFGLVIYAWIKKVRRNSYQREHIEYSRLTKEDELEDA